MKFGEPGEIRTPGPLIKSQLRYQLRHRLRYIRRLFCRQQALSPSRRVDFCFMLHQTRNPNVDWATSSLLVCILHTTGEEWHILYFLKILVFFFQLLPIRESKPNSLLEPPITNRNAVIFIG